METLFADTVTNVNKERLERDFAGRGATLAFRGGSVGVKGGRRLHVGHMHVMQGKVHPQGALWPKTSPSPGTAGLQRGDSDLLLGRRRGNPGFQERF